ncbi:MAG: peptidoglycan DD-metalloendopeptidase family protein [Paracoccaceae bacterium]
MADIRRSQFRAALLVGALLVLSACEQAFDFDFRSLGNGFDTSNAARQATVARPVPDDRGIISYPNFQVAVAQPGDRIGDIAARIGLPAAELARYNGIPLDAVLRADEVVALPRRVAEPSPATGAIGTGPIQLGNAVDISTLAGDAIERAGSTTPPNGASAQTGREPIRHRVEAGETAFSISRLYNVSVRSLAQWNGLGSDLTVRSGQYLLIPVSADGPPPQNQTSAPGQGSPTPVPPSAAAPLPTGNDTAAATTPGSPDLANDRTAASDNARLAMPVDGRIIRAYEKGENEGIDIAAPAGAAVRSAADGTVAAITRDTEQVPIIVLRHADGLLTVYAGVDKVSIKRGDKVSRGQQIAVVRAGSPSFLHFEVRQGLDSIDPMQFLN